MRAVRTPSTLDGRRGVLVEGALAEAEHAGVLLHHPAQPRIQLDVLGVHLEHELDWTTGVPQVLEDVVHDGGEVRDRTIRIELDRAEVAGALWPWRSGERPRRRLRGGDLINALGCTLDPCLAGRLRLKLGSRHAQLDHERPLWQPGELYPRAQALVAAGGRVEGVLDGDPVLRPGHKRHGVDDSLLEHARAEESLEVEVARERLPELTHPDVTVAPERGELVVEVLAQEGRGELRQHLAVVLEGACHPLRERSWPAPHPALMELIGTERVDVLGGDQRETVGLAQLLDEGALGALELLAEDALLLGGELDAAVAEVVAELAPGQHVSGGLAAATEPAQLRDKE